MSNTEVGVLIDPSQPRDAIHIAVAPVCASKKLKPGTSIAFVQGSNIDVEEAPWAVSVGIVDPFLRQDVQKGQHFWMWLHPNTITSLKHNWTHPAFSDEMVQTKDKAASEAWLRGFCDNSDCPEYEKLIGAIKGEDVSGGDDYYSITVGDTYISVSGWDAHGDIPDEFWDHVEVVTGKKFKERPTHFSCSC